MWRRVSRPFVIEATDPRVQFPGVARAYDRRVRCPGALRAHHSSVDCAATSRSSDVKRSSGACSHLRGQSGVVWRRYPERAHIRQTSFRAPGTCQRDWRSAGVRFPIPDGMCLRRWISENETRNEGEEVGRVPGRDLTFATIERQ